MRDSERLRALRRLPTLIDQVLRQGRYDFVYDEMALSVRGMGMRKRLNLLRSGLNLVHRRAWPWAMPLHMQFELSSLCNLHCLVCPTGRGELRRPAQFMDPKLFREVWNQVAPFLLTASLWGWGESMLHPALGAILQAARLHPVVTFLSTNGANLDRDAVTDLLLDSPPTYLIVSIDGLHDDTHSQFRVGARLAPVLAGVERLARLKAERGQRLPVLHMRTLALKHNQHELADAAAFAANHGFDMSSLRPLVSVGTPIAARAHDALIPDAAELRAYAYRDGQRAQPANSVCMQPFWFPSLYADGTVVACEQDVHADRPLGRVDNQHAFLDVWRSLAAAQVRRTIRDRTSDIALCRACPLCRVPSASGNESRAGRKSEYFRPGLSPLVVESGQVP